MKATIFTAALLTIIATASFAQTTVPTGKTPYTQTQIKPLIRTASTSADYMILRDYYTQKAETARLQAAEEKREWERRSANPVAYGRKYPTPIDSAHYLYESFLQSADASQAQAERYGKLAGSSNSRQ